MTRLSLIFDADDTLWQCNSLFERVIEDYLDWLAHPTISREKIRDVLDDIERANAATHGYGTAVFLRCLRDCFEHLNVRPATARELSQIETLAGPVVRHEIDLIPGVSDTLEELGRRHDLYLLTKGDSQEQRRKVAESGLSGHFLAVEVVPEKDVEVYRRIAASYSLVPERTWMIGNSPKSDILPARAAGMNAVYIPDPQPWILEHASLDMADSGVLKLAAFTELVQHF